MLQLEVRSFKPYFRAATNSVSPTYDTPIMQVQRLLLSALALALVLTDARLCADDRALTAVPITEFRHETDPPMQLPTDLAVTRDGQVFVADGLADRILHFDLGGRLIKQVRQVGEHMLSRPLATSIDPNGLLWIADTGHSRVLVRAADGSLDRIVKPDVPGDHGLDITDIAPTPDGSAVWVVDNDNHRLLRVELQTGAASAFGKRGESLGQLQYPFMVALGRSGHVLVTDVINGRVAQFNSKGQPAKTIAEYGVELGQFYRPKGIVTDKSDNIWVSDSVLGVIQVFNPDGGLIDALRDSTGNVLHLDSPMGMAFDGDENLYVVETTAARVRKFKIVRGDPKTISPPRKPPEVVGATGRSCTVCHIEMMAPLSRGVGTIIADPPATSEQEPAVSRAEMCLSCHDGSIVDSRKRVWQLHGHATGMTPPADMRIPPNLPLVNGTVACRTCHSAHMGGQFTGDLRSSIFLRVPNKSSELCISCHQDKTRGPKLGTQPIGGMPWPVPRELIDAGARVGPNPRELTCQVCHTPHGSAEDHLLVRGTDSNQLCLSCHDQLRPGMFRDGSHAEHPISPVVNPAQAAAIKDMGTKLGPGEHLLCLSCHKLHHGKGERFMLADELTDGRFCIRCHQEKTSVLKTDHDLRSRFRDERNRLGMTPSSGGPCSSCHMFHRYARTPEESTVDPGGKCITCHQQGRCAESRVLGSVNHPGVSCNGCHDPHMSDHPAFLRNAPGQVCSSCHKQQAGLVGGPHDMARAAGAWPAESREIADPCLACHRPHGNEDTGLFRMAGSLGGVDAGCRACHAANLWDVPGDKSAVHPQFARNGTIVSCLPLDDANGKMPSIACKTCHDPHAGPQSGAMLLRVAAGRPAQDVCINCHAGMSHLALTGHSGTSLAKAGFDVVACGPCHTVHADAGAIEQRLLRPISLTAAGKASSTGDSASAACVACHRPNGPAKPPVIASHPEIALPMAAVAGATIGLPLFDQQGMPSPSGRIACQTCHVPHGGPPPGGSDAASLSAAQQRAMRLLLREFAAPNLCTTCHGSDGLRRFLYFHDPRRRAGPIEPMSVDSILSRRADAVGIKP